MSGGGLAGWALRKVNEELGTSYYPRNRRGPAAPTSKKPLAVRARITDPGLKRVPGWSRYQLSGRYVISQRMQHARHRFWAFLFLTFILLALFIICFGLGIPLRR